MPDQPKDEIDADGDRDTPEDAPPPALPPYVERYKNGQGEDDEPGRDKVRKTRVKPKHWTKFVEAFCAVALVCITFYYAKAAYRQARASEIAAGAARDAVGVALRTLGETERSNERQATLTLQARSDAQKASDVSAKSAKDALSATINNFRLEQRSWIDIAPPTIFPTKGTPYRIHMLVHNTGRTPAKNIVIKFNSNYFPPPQEPVFKFWGEPLHVGSLAPNGSTEFAGPEISTAQFPSQTLYLFGSVTYQDVFGASHWITYCFFTHRTGVWGYYKIHNDIGDGKPPFE